MGSRLTILLLTLLVTFLEPVNSCAQDSGPTQDVLAFWVSNGEGVPPKAHFDLGLCEANKSYKLDLELHNRTTSNIEFDSASLTCSCTDFEPKSGVVEAGSKLAARLKLAIPALPKSAESGGTFALKKDGRVVATVTYSYQLGGYIGFADEMVILSVPEGTKSETFSLPVVIGASVDPSRLRFVFHGSKANATLRFDAEGRTLNGILKFSDSKEDVSNYELGSVQIQGPSRDVGRTTIPVLIQHVGAFQVIPNRMRFRWDADSSRHKGIFFVRSDLFARSTNGEDDLFVDLQVSGYASKERFGKPKNGLLRVEVELLPNHSGEKDIDEAPQSTVEAKTQIRFGAHASLVPVKAVLKKEVK